MHWECQLSWIHLRKSQVFNLRKFRHWQVHVLLLEEPGDGFWDWVLRKQQVVVDCLCRAVFSGIHVIPNVSAVLCGVTVVACLWSLQHQTNIFGFCIKIGDFACWPHRELWVLGKTQKQVWTWRKVTQHWHDSWLTPLWTSAVMKCCGWIIWWYLKKKNKTVHKIQFPTIIIIISSYIQQYSNCWCVHNPPVEFNSVAHS